MSTGRTRPFSRFSFTQHFLFASAAILLTGMLVIGLWLQHQIEASVVNRTSALAAVYVESIVAAHLRPLPLVAPLDAATRAEFDRLFIEGPLHRDLVRVKLWGRDGTVVYSTDGKQIGSRFPMGSGLVAAFGGAVQASMSKLEDPDNQPERSLWQQLIEVYVPVHAAGAKDVLTVVEFYHSTESLMRDVRAAQRRSWWLIVATTLATFLLLGGMVRRASRTIRNQQRYLRQQLRRLRGSLAENERMRWQLEKAGERTTSLNEQFLHRIAADLHDGPAQELALALLRIDALGDAQSDCATLSDATAQDFRTIREAMAAGLDELRAIARGLGNPGIAPLSLGETARRAVRNFERKSGHKVQLDIDDGLDDAPLAVKITLYRVLQESLANAWVHGEGRGLRVRLCPHEGSLRMEVIDHGPGFDPQTVSTAGRLGIAFMVERVRLLGGEIKIDSVPGRGTRVSARVPLSLGEARHE